MAKIQGVKVPKEGNWFKRRKILTVVGSLIILGIIGSASSSKTPTTTASTSASSATTPTTSPSPAKVAVRQVTGIATTLGAGTFTSGKDVAVGLYDVTTGAGQSGNFTVSGTDTYNEVLGVSEGLGVSKIRVKISSGDSIQISGLSSIIFTPVTVPFVTTHTAETLYAGTFTVGQDIGAGRYVAATTAGSSGNFIVTGSNNVDEVLGVSDGLGVPSVTTNLTDGDVVSISGLDQVTMTPSN